MNLNARAAARLLGVPEAKVYEWAGEGILPSYSSQDQLRFNRVELIEWAAARKMRVAADLFEGDPRARSAVRLSSALLTGGIHRALEARDERSALEAVAALLPLPAGVDRETIAALFAARRGITPLGDGIAIPHARAPVVLRVEQPIVALAFLARPVEAAHAGGKPVSILFAIVSPTIRAHLDVLSKIGSALSDRSFHALVTRQGPDAEIHAALSALEAASQKTPPRDTEGHES